MDATITDRQIRTLETEAAEAGDLLQVALCRIALGRWTGHEAVADALADSDWSDVNPRDPSDVARVRQACEAAILAGQG